MIKQLYNRMKKTQDSEMQLLRDIIDSIGRILSRIKTLELTITEINAEVKLLREDRHYCGVDFYVEGEETWVTDGVTVNLMPGEIFDISFQGPQIPGKGKVKCHGICAITDVYIDDKYVVTAPRCQAREVTIGDLSPQSKIEVRIKAGYND